MLLAPGSTKTVSGPVAGCRPGGACESSQAPPATRVATTARAAVVLTIEMRRPGAAWLSPMTRLRTPGSRLITSAEDRGFEPLRAVNPTRFPSERHRPLGE